MTGHVHVLSLLPIIISCFTIIGATLGQTPSVSFLNSSLNATNRNYACPHESVAYSCDVFGSELHWHVDDDSLGYFTMNDSMAGTGFTINGSDLNEQFQCLIFSGVLDIIINDTEDNSQYMYLYFHSTLTVSMDHGYPTNTSCQDPNYEPLNIICSVPVLEGQTPNISSPYKVAGKYTCSKPVYRSYNFIVYIRFCRLTQ